MALDINLVRLMERLVAVAEKVLKDGITIHHHHYEHEVQPEYAVTSWVPPQPEPETPPTAGGKGA